MSELETLEKEILSAIKAASTLEDLEKVRVEAVGKKGKVSALMSKLGQMPPEERKSFGQSVNAIKQNITSAIEASKSTLETAVLNQRLLTEREDITLPTRQSPVSQGRIHPISQVWEEITEIFADLGFAMAEGPHIEGDENNFTKLNIPAEHPARQEHDTFYFNEKPDGSRRVLRTHTSPVQIRTMENQKPPIRIIAPGRVYRCDSDQTHTPMFHQVEGLVIDKETHMGHLKWVLEEFCKAFFEVDDITMRFRASHFPFTEPSAEVDIGYSKKGEEILFGGSENWMEILGCGMVHPNVLTNVGLDPEIYQGFAFGVGIDRLAMLKYGMPDLRAFFQGDMRWLNHYGFLVLDVPTLAGGL